MFYIFNYIFEKKTFAFKKLYTLLYYLSKTINIIKTYINFLNNNQIKEP